VDGEVRPVGEGWEKGEGVKFGEERREGEGEGWGVKEEGELGRG